MISMTIPSHAEYGGSAAAIRHHYDVGRDFYKLWLDQSMTYSCALWNLDDVTDTLDRAQKRKIEFHLDAAYAQRARFILDIGCGWGGLLRQASATCSAERIVGLTLSHDQARYLESSAPERAEVRLESWVHHKPASKYDSIISVGAFEHFAKPEDAVTQKIALYRDFFERCRDWLSPEGRMSLQTIAYGTMKREEASQFINTEIFPNADLPTLGEIVTATEGIFEITMIRNDRLHYAKTFSVWAGSLRDNRHRATSLVGSAVSRRYERYLTQSSLGFLMGKIGLLRIALRPLSTRWSVLAKP